MPGELLKLDGICFHGYASEPLIKGFSIALEPRQILWITGPAGCGKTTLLRIILKDIRPDNGEIHFQGEPLFSRLGMSRSLLRRSIGVIFQDDSLIDHRTAFANVALPLQITGQPREKLVESTAHALSEVGLLTKANHTTGKLLGTERRLLALARVIAKSPPLVLADLNSCDTDQRVIAPYLEKMASYGSGVIIFSRNRSMSRTEIGSASQMEIG